MSRALQEELEAIGRGIYCKFGYTGPTGLRVYPCRGRDRSAVRCFFNSQEGWTMGRHLVAFPLICVRNELAPCERTGNAQSRLCGRAVDLHRL